MGSREARLPSCDMDDLARIDLRHEVRTISFENPTGERGTAGSAADGRKGAANRFIAPGEAVDLADIEGPGRVRHIWLTVPPMPPECMRALQLEVFYDGAEKPSVSVPCLDYFATPHGRPTPFASSLVAVQEGRGYNSWIPMPFRRHLRVVFRNASDRHIPLYYQISLTREPVDEEVGVLHAAFRRENPTQLREDFTIVEGLHGPGRFLGSSIGLRVLPDPGFSWYGEGEVKLYLDDDGPLPTWCSTGLEDYVGTAWGMGQHHTTYQGAPLILQAPGETMPAFVSFYRWHVPDPIVFRESLRATLQQLGAVPVPRGETQLRRRIEEEGRSAGGGFFDIPRGPLEAFGVCERRDDVCATAFLYLRDVQAVPRVDVGEAIADVARREWESPLPFEEMAAMFGDGGQN